ncbi:hypothetical protein MTO96_020624 [Rhipicephalus appendiculatus]
MQRLPKCKWLKSAKVIQRHGYTSDEMLNRWRFCMCDYSGADLCILGALGRICVARRCLPRDARLSKLSKSVGACRSNGPRISGRVPWPTSAARGLERKAPPPDKGAADKAARPPEERAKKKKKKRQDEAKLR